MSCSLQEHLGCFLKRCFGNRTNIVIVNTVSEDRNQLVGKCHSVAQHAKVMEINVGTVKLNDFCQLVINGLSSGLNSKHIINLNNIIAKSSSGVNVVKS